ncbi:unnamed protein product [Chondrus crispus]|uniref:Uncharacterized protein n=1 Tax=Chondrus crispus TaxID=2769 RepID=R7QE90_CHOCR|nr:unnamed protein product [Chondrus crispus]CDF35776.1 unnamed protein product [Chondrus crispus]|eukprot:XP_005715595.1 unnamed protein product [Chondrus crispus]
MVVWRAEGAGEEVRLGGKRGWESEVSKIGAWGGVSVGKRSARFGEWRVEVGAGEGVVMGFLVAMAECLVELGDEQWLREWRRRKVGEEE